MYQLFTAILFSGFFCISLAWGIEFKTANRATSTNEISHILQDIEKLNSPEFQGRQAGTIGGERSARFVSKRFKALGLRSWIQTSPLTTTTITSPTGVKFFPITHPPQKTNAPLEIGKDYLPILDSPAVHLTAPVIFVGYGISDPARGIDDYHNMNVHNRIVLFFRGKPPAYSRWVTHEEKVRTAQQQGASGFLTVTGPLLSRYEARKGLGQIPLAIYSSTPENRPLPGVWLNGQSLDQQLSTIHESLESLQQQANTNPGKSTRSLPLLAQLSWKTHQESGKLINVFGMLPGKDPLLRNEAILIGAHRDSFGKQAGLLFPGADDNASGTSVMLELARQFAREKKKSTRSILFISFDGEERGLLGSEHYIRNLGWPLKKTVAMINLDHVGIGNGKLTVGVTRLEKSIVKQAASQIGLSKKIKLYGYFPGGDHVPFYEADIPTVTVVSEGVHPNFHQPTDTADTINPEVLQTATSFVLSLVDLLANPSSETKK